MNSGVSVTFPWSGSRGNFSLLSLNHITQKFLEWSQWEMSERWGKWRTHSIFITLKRRGEKEAMVPRPGGDESHPQRPCDTSFPCCLQGLQVTWQLTGISHDLPAQCLCLPGPGTTALPPATFQSPLPLLHRGFSHVTCTFRYHSNYSSILFPVCCPSEEFNLLEGKELCLVCCVPDT